MLYARPKVIYIILCAFASFFLCSRASATAAQNYVWSAAANGLWNNTANWTPAGYPGENAADTATFNAGAVNCTGFGGVAPSFASLTINSGYSGAITQDSSLTLSASFTMGGGTFTSSAAVSVGANYVQTGGTFTQGGTTTITGSFALGAGTFNNNAGLTIGGNFGQTGGTFTPNGSATVTFNSASAQMILDTSALTFNNLTHSGAGTLGVWLYSKAITLYSAQVSSLNSPYTNFPVFIKISNDTDLGKNARSDGKDIVFTDANGKYLNYELEPGNYSASGGVANGFFWVQIPSLSSSANTTIYMFYGNPQCSTSPQNQAATWNDGIFQGVWHCSDAVTPAVDSTGNHNMTTTAPVTFGQAPFPQLIGYATYYNNAGYLSFTPGANLAGAYTVSAWVYPTGTNGVTPIGYVGSRNPGGGYDGTFDAKLQTWGSAYNPIHGDVGAGGGTWYNTAVDSTATYQWSAGNTWVQITYIATTSAGANGWYVYANGGSAPMVNTAAYGGGGPFNPLLWGTHNPFCIGYTGESGELFIGYINEVRVSNAIRTAGWINTEYNNISNPLTVPNNFESFGAVLNCSLVTINGALTQSAGGGTLVLNPATTVAGNFTLTSGTLDAPASTLTLSGSTITFNTSGGTFNADSGTVIFSGTGGTQTLNGSTTFYNFKDDTSGGMAAATLTFTAGTTQTFSGLLTLKGNNTNKLILQSSTTAAWSITPTVGQWVVYNVTVSYSTNTISTYINPTNSLNNGNTTNWFPAGLYWIGGTGSWSQTAHWAATSGGAGPAGPPNNTQFAIFDVNSGTGTCTVDTATNNILGLSMAGGASPTTMTVTQASADAMTIGTGGISVAGGTLNLGANNTCSGGTALSGGTLNFTTAASTLPLGVATNTWTISGGTFDNTSGSAFTLGGYLQKWNGNFTFTGSSSLNVGAGAATLLANSQITVSTGASTLTVGGAVGDGGLGFGITKAGSGTLTLNTTNTFSGGITLAATAGSLNLTGTNQASGITMNGADGGTITVAAAGSIGPATTTITFGSSSNDILIINAATTVAGLTSSSSSAVIKANTNAVLTANISGIITYAGFLDNGTATLGLTKNGIGTLILSNAASTYSGVTTINAGILSASTLALGGSNSSIGAATNAPANLVLSGGELQYTGGNVTTDHDFTLTATTTSTIEVGNSATTLIFGTSNANGIGSSSGGLKVGVTGNSDGTLNLHATNTYTGSTTVNAGTLLVSGSTSSGSVFVNNGAILNVTGTVGGALTVNSGGTVEGIGTVSGAMTINGITIPGSSGASF